MRRLKTLLELNCIVVMVGAATMVNAVSVSAQTTCKAAEPVMLSLMVTIDHYCPGLRLTNDGVATFNDVWNRGERSFGGLFMSRCITENIIQSGWPLTAQKPTDFRIPSYWCSSAIDLLEGWRTAMAKKRGPLAERITPPP